MFIFIGSSFDQIASSSLSVKYALLRESYPAVKDKKGHFSPLLTLSKPGGLLLGKSFNFLGFSVVLWASAKHAVPPQ